MADPKIDMKLGILIASLRKARGWSRAELARRLGVTEEGVGHWERHQRRPTSENMAALADIFGLELTLAPRDGAVDDDGAALIARLVAALPSIPPERRGMLPTLIDEYEHLATKS